MSARAFLLALAVLLLAQFLGSSAYDIGGARPDFLFLLVAYLALNGSRIRVLAMAASIGALRDLLSIAPLGAGLIGYPLGTLGILLVRNLYPREAWGLRLLAIVLGDALARVGTLLGTTIQVQHYASAATWPLAAGIVYTGCLGVVLLPALDRLVEGHRPA